MGMVIGVALYLWNEKIILMKKEQQLIVNDGAELKAVISDLEAIANEINCISFCEDDDAERSCLKKCQTESKKRRENLKEITERTTAYNAEISESELELAIIKEFQKRNRHLLEK